MPEAEIIQALRNNEPFRGLSNVRVVNVEPQEKQGAFDIKFDLEYGKTAVSVYRVNVYGKLQNAWTPKQVEQIAPWLSQMKAAQPGTAFALVCPAMSPRSQSLCFERNADFIDLAGNVFINVPGKLLLQRVGQKAAKEINPSFYRDPFSAKSSRILRALLQKPKPWTLREITEELATETQRGQCPGLTFEVSAGFASRVLRSLEEQVLVVHKPTPIDPDQAVPEQNVEEAVGTRGNPLVVPEPKRLLDAWAEKYKERFRWNLRKSFKLPNPFGPDLPAVVRGLEAVLKSNAATCYVFTATAAASLRAPFVDIDLIDIFIADWRATDKLRTSISGPGLGPELRIIYPYDVGVLMYRANEQGIPVVSDVQAYLDLFARGGRDLKQADYLFQKRIAPTWKSK